MKPSSKTESAPETLRILIVEDNEDDAKLMLRQVRAAGFDIRHSRVQDEPAFRRALAGEKWDFILADYSLPQFNAQKALMILRDDGKDIPFIVVSGKIGEEQAVELVKSGASDYVMKDKLARLGEAVRRELREARVRADHRKSVEQLRLAHEDLARSNQDLDQFAYVASHDLKSPLHAIANYAQWVLQDAGEGLPEKSREHLAKLTLRVKKMHSLLDDLLAYSRAGRTASSPVKIETKLLVSEVLALVQVPESFRVEVGELPDVISARVPLELVFRNLIGNAVQHHNQADGSVRISGSCSGNWCEFVVADDGPGIAPEYHGKIFEMFQSLRAGEGSGMGLALVKKLVEGQGGRITLESGPGRGAAFRFTWPKGT